MTYEEHLFLKLIEECSEVQHRVSKLLQFGPEEAEPGQSLKNWERLSIEIKDLLVIITLLQERGLLAFFPTDEMESHAKQKRSKIEKFAQYSKFLGRIKEDTN